MRLKAKTMLAAVAALALAATGITGSVAQQAAPAVELPQDQNVLFWTQDQRDLAFRMFDSVSPTNRIRAGSTTLALRTAAPLSTDAAQIDAYMERQRLAGLIVLHDGKIRLERYGLGFGAEGRWTSFSVAKSFTSTLVGAAIQDGHIGSLSDPVTRYIPALTGSGYDGVTVAQLLAMSSGVRWNEDYTDPNSDVARFLAQAPEGDVDAVTAYMRRLPRAHAPGTQWNYNTGETNLIGVLVERATGKTLSDYMTEKVWQPFGMEGDATWLLNASREEVSGCCMQMRLRDYGRFGLFVLGGGRASGQQVVPDGWYAAAGTKQAEIGRPGFGYGYQWWTYDDGSFAAQGIFGQGIFIDPARNLVIAGVGNWPTATDRERGAERLAFYRSVQQSIDRERAAQ